MSSSFRVAQDDPLDVNVDELLGGNLSSEGSVWVHGAVLGSNVNMGLFFGELHGDEVKVDGGDDDIWR